MSRDFSLANVYTCSVIYSAFCAQSYTRIGLSHFEYNSNALFQVTYSHLLHSQLSDSKHCTRSELGLYCLDSLEREGMPECSKLVLPTDSNSQIGENAKTTGGGELK